MFVLADKYAITSLRDLAKTKFEQATKEDFSAQSFAYAADLIYNKTLEHDRGLRNIVVKTLNCHRALIKYEGIAALLKSGDGLAWELIQALL